MEKIIDTVRNDRCQIFTMDKILMLTMVAPTKRLVESSGQALRGLRCCRRKTARQKRAVLFVSVLVHIAVAVLALVTWLPLLFPGRPMIAVRTTEDILRDPDLNVQMLPPLPKPAVLPEMTDTRSAAGVRAELAKLERSDAKAKAAAARSAASRSKG